MVASIINKIAKISDYIAGAVGAIAMLMICYEVLARFFMSAILTDWGLEIIIYMTVWAMFVPVINLPLQRRHVSADFVVNRLSNTTRYKLEIIASFAGLIFCIILFWYGLKVVEFAYTYDERGMTSLQFPVWIYYTFLPVSMVLQCIGYALRIFYDLKSSPDELFNAKENEI